MPIVAPAIGAILFVLTIGVRPALLTYSPVVALCLAAVAAICVGNQVRLSSIQILLLSALTALTALAFLLDAGSAPQGALLWFQVPLGLVLAQSSDRALKRALNTYLVLYLTTLSVVFVMALPNPPQRTLYSDHKQAAGYAAALALVSVASEVQSRGWTSRLAGAAAVITLGVVLSTSVAAAGCASAVILVGARRRRDRKRVRTRRMRVIAGCLAAAGLLPLLLVYASHRGKDSTLTDRTEIWGELLNVDSGTLLLGHGPGTLWRDGQSTTLLGDPDVHTAKIRSDLRARITSSHSLYIEMIGQYGTLLAALLLALLLHRAYEAVRTNNQRVIALAMFALVGGLAESSITTPTLGVAAMAVALRPKVSSERPNNRIRDNGYYHRARLRHSRIQHSRGQAVA